MGRKYYGRAYATRCYRGPKSINIQVEPTWGIKFATAILSATENGKPFDIAVYDEGKKRGKIYLTVTSAK
jgi:hypothetical protein